MKAFAIKNKEGKYFEPERGLSNFYELNFCGEHYFYETKQDAEESIEFYNLKNCKVVEITIAEGDKDKEIKELKEQLVEKDKEIERLNDRLDKYISGRLKSMIAEKDEEIEKLKRYLQLERAFTPARGDGKTFTRLNVIQDFINSIRKQVCDEIKKSFDEHRKMLQSNYDECIFSMDDIIEELEELEQAKESMK